jgi:hypothetical protein
MVLMIFAIVGFFVLSIALMVGQYYYVRHRIDQKIITYLESLGYHVLSLKKSNQKFNFKEDKSTSLGYKSMIKHFYIDGAGNGTKVLWKEVVVLSEGSSKQETHLLAVETVLANPVNYHLQLQ